MHRSLARGTGCARMRISGRYFGNGNLARKKNKSLKKSSRHLTDTNRNFNGMMYVYWCVCMCALNLSYALSIYLRHRFFFGYRVNENRLHCVGHSYCVVVLSRFSDIVWSGGCEGLVVSVCTLEKRRKNRPHTITQSNSPRKNGYTTFLFLNVLARSHARLPPHITWHFEWLLSTHITWTSSLYRNTCLYLCFKNVLLKDSTRLDSNVRLAYMYRESISKHTRPINRLH